MNRRSAVKCIRDTIFYGFPIFGWLLIGSLGFATRANGEPVPRHPTDAYYSSVEFGKSLLKLQPAERLIEIPYSELHAAIRYRDDLKTMIRKEARPKRQSDLTVAVFAAEDASEHDLVEFRWVYQGYPLRLIAGRNAQQLDFPLSPLEPDRLEEAKRLVAGVITDTDYWETKHYSTDFRWPAALEDGITFSSNAEKNILGLMSWYDRLDAFVQGDTLSVLIYKRVPQLMYFLDGSKWFPEDFRKHLNNQENYHKSNSYERSLSFGMTLIKDQPRNDFLQQAAEDPKALPWDTDHLFFMPPETRKKLYTEKPGTTRVFVARNDTEDDLIERIYTLEGYEFRYLASRNAVKLELDLRAVNDRCAERDRMECVKELIAKLVWLQGTDKWDRLEYDIQLPWPRDLVDRVQICSNSEKSFRRLYAWHERVDAFVQGKTLSILLYKRIPKDTQWLDGSKWFNDAFRHAVLQRSRE